MNEGVAVSGINETQKFLAALKGQIPFATSVALNEVGKEVISAQKDEMSRVFDEPTPYTLGALFKTKATKANLETRTRIKSPNPIEASQTDKRYIGVQIYGGTRKDKASERKLRAKGILPYGYQMVPGAGLSLNKYGNVSGARVQAILSALGVTGYKKTAAGTFVVGEVGGTKGIWKVQAKKWVPIFIFVKTPNYESRYDYQAISTKTFERRWAAIFNEAALYALRTAR